MSSPADYDPSKPPYYGMEPDAPAAPAEPKKAPVKKAAAKEKDAE